MRSYGAKKRTRAQKYAALQLRLVNCRSLDGFDPDAEAQRSGLQADAVRSMFKAEQLRRAQW